MRRKNIHESDRKKNKRVTEINVIYIQQQQVLHRML
jgi:hypothetical protein